MDTKDIIQQIESYQQRITHLRAKLNKQGQEFFPAKVFHQTITDRWAMYNGDCVKVTRGLPDNSIHYSIFSPPFISLYVYSDSPQDMGNSKTDKEFYTHFDYFVNDLFRVIMPGRLVSVHCSVLPLSIQRDGRMGLKDFPGELVRLFSLHGFIYHSKVMIWKDPLLQAVRTKNLTLAHKQISKDSSRCAQGIADEILTFRKPGKNSELISHGRGLEQYIGELPEPKEPKRDDPKTNKYSHLVWQRYASPVWMDINQSDTLNFRVAREKNDERHICPLQLQVISRCLELWTNPNDIVFSPFAGIGSEGYESLRRGRRFIGVELKESYYQTSLNYLKAAEKTLTSMKL